MCLKLSVSLPLYRHLCLSLTNQCLSFLSGKISPNQIAVRIWTIRTGKAKNPDNVSFNDRIDI
jgi:hypothetical protein